MRKLKSNYELIYHEDLHYPSMLCLIDFLFLGRIVCPKHTWEGFTPPTLYVLSVLYWSDRPTTSHSSFLVWHKKSAKVLCVVLICSKGMWRWYIMKSDWWGMKLPLPLWISRVWMKCILINMGRGRGGYLNIWVRGDGGEMVVLLLLGTVLYCSHMLYRSCAISQILYMCQIISSLTLRMIKLVFLRESAIFPWCKSHLGLRRIVT